MEVDRGRYEPLPLALRGPIEQVESYLVRPITPQRSPRRGSGSPLSRTVVGLESSMRLYGPISSHKLIRGL